MSPRTGAMSIGGVVEAPGVSLSPGVVERFRHCIDRFRSAPTVPSMMSAVVAPEAKLVPPKTAAPLPPTLLFWN